MSKPSSGHFSGTAGSKNPSRNIAQNQSNNAIISSRRLDTREHPTKYRQLSSKKLRALREKAKSRTITKSEYAHLNWQTRLTKRRKEGVKAFWDREKYLITHNLPTTRNWSANQRAAIINHKQPKYRGITMHSHHTFSVSKYPHLANHESIIYPVTRNEHINRWHNRNFRKSLSGKPININFKEEF